MSKEFCKCGRSVNEQGSTYCCRMCNLGYGSHSKMCDRRYYNMANAYKCDRCGNYSDGIPPWIVTHGAATTVNEVGGKYVSMSRTDYLMYQLCDPCHDVIVKALDPKSLTSTIIGNDAERKPVNIQGKYYVSTKVDVHSGPRKWKACENAPNEHMMHLWTNEDDGLVICPGAITQFINPLWGL